VGVTEIDQRRVGVAHGAFFCLGLAAGIVVTMAFHRGPPPPAQASAPIALTAKPADSAWAEGLADVQRRLDAQILRIDEHGTRLHDLEVINRAQCK
jgi:hypothetical protein